MKNHLELVTRSQNRCREGAETALQVWRHTFPGSANEQLFVLYKVCQVYLADVHLVLAAQPSC